MEGLDPVSFKAFGEYRDEPRVGVLDLGSQQPDEPDSGEVVVLVSLVGLLDPPLRKIVIVPVDFDDHRVLGIRDDQVRLVGPEVVRVELLFGQFPHPIIVALVDSDEEIVKDTGQPEIAL